MKEKILKAVEELQKKQNRFIENEQCQLNYWHDQTQTRPLLVVSDLTDEQDAFFGNMDLEEIHHDQQKMLLAGLKEVFKVVNAKGRSVPSVRSNRGCGIFPTLLGVEQKIFPDKMPWVTKHLDKETLQQMDGQTLKISDAFQQGLEDMTYMAKMLENTGCRVYPMDVQGPFDVAHIVYGDRVFYDIYDDPDFLHHLLDLSTKAIELGFQACLDVMPDSDKVIAHYNNLVMPKDLGGLKISEDTSTLLSKEQIEEFVIPYTQRLLKTFNGGYIHYCGQNNHLFNAVMDMEKVYGINFGNPEMHNMNEILRMCHEKQIVYYGHVENAHNLFKLTSYFLPVIYAKAHEQDEIIEKFSL